MAHFAVVNDDNVVVDVYVVENKHLIDENGIEQESLGIETCKKFYQHYPETYRFIQTSYNTVGNRHYTNNEYDGTAGLRKNFAGIGWIYDDEKDAFYSPAPYPSWVFNETEYVYEPPIAFPLGDTDHYWDEETQNWIPVQP